MATQTRVLGLDELKALLAQLPSEFGKKVLRKGGSAGSQVVKAAVIADAPVASKAHRRGVAPGLLKRATIVKFVRESSNDDQATYIVTFRQGKGQQALQRGRGANKTTVSLDAFYARWVERGHRIVGRASRSGVLRRKVKPTASGSVQGLFFFAKALRETSDKALDAMVAAMTTEAKKLPGIS